MVTDIQELDQGPSQADLEQRMLGRLVRAHPRLVRPVTLYGLAYQQYTGAAADAGLVDDQTVFGVYSIGQDFSLAKIPPSAEYIEFQQDPTDANYNIRYRADGGGCDIATGMVFNPTVTQTVQMWLRDFRALHFAFRAANQHLHVSFYTSRVSDVPAR